MLLYKMKVYVEMLLPFKTRIFFGRRPAFLERFAVYISFPRVVPRFHGYQYDRNARNVAKKFSKKILI